MNNEKENTMALTFSGGIYPEQAKLTSDRAIEEMQATGFVTIPLSQHIGTPATPIVSVGDRVCKGQKIGEGAEDCSCPVHSSVSGTVTAIETVSTIHGEALAVTVENDFREELSPDIHPFDKTLQQATAEELIAFIREKGIVGLGGTAFPTWQKVQSARGKADTLVINCAESEPYLTGNHRLLLEKPEEIISGVKILLRATGAEKAIFAIEDNKPDAAVGIGRLVAKSDNFAVAVMKSKYPQGDEKELVYTLFQKKIPQGGHPTDLGYTIFNPETCWAVYRSFVTGLPCISRVVTVSGDCMKAPGNLLVPVGVSLQAVIDRCGGFSIKPDRLLIGGPMMGKAQWSTEVPCTKEVCGILAISGKIPKAGSCIHCGRCLRACPMHLMPLELVRAVQDKNKKELKSLYVEVCNECGCCSYVCPAKIPILQHIRIGKDMLSASTHNK